MILDHQLAQQIVDRTMAIIDNNINVMNQAGIIIASGDKQRIGELHDGALLALKRKDTVEVTKQSSDALKGAKEGVNLLLKYNDDIIGVVGITGDPVTLKNYARLVKMTAEMAIEQASLTEQLQWDKRHKQELIVSWINNQLSASQLEHQATMLEIDVASPRLAILIKINAPSVTQQQNAVRQLIGLLERTEKSSLIAMISLDEVVLLKTLPAKSEKGEQELLEKLYRQISQSFSYKFKLALGQSFADASQLHLAFKSSRQVMAFGESHFPAKQCHLFDDYRMAMLISPIRNQWQEKELMLPYQKLLACDTNGQLQKTLNTLFEQNGNLKQCAETLSIHRNTLRYRLAKIEQLTGIVTSDFSGLVELYLASQLAKLDQN